MGSKWCCTCWPVLHFSCQEPRESHVSCSWCTSHREWYCWLLGSGRSDQKGRGLPSLRFIELPVLFTILYFLLQGVTECYECQPKGAQKSFPGCTIRNTPSEPIHCIVWAKHLFKWVMLDAHLHLYTPELWSSSWDFLPLMGLFSLYQMPWAVIQICGQQLFMFSGYLKFNLAVLIKNFSDWPSVLLYTKVDMWDFHLFSWKNLIPEINLWPTVFWYSDHLHSTQTMPLYSYTVFIQSFDSLQSVIWWRGPRSRSIAWYRRPRSCRLWPFQLFMPNAYATLD